MEQEIDCWNPETNALFSLGTSAFDKFELDLFHKYQPSYRERVEMYKKNILDSHDHVHVIILNMMDRDI